MDKKETQTEFESVTFMHEQENEIAVQRQHENRCLACNNTGVAHLYDEESGEEYYEPCPCCQNIMTQEQQEDYIDTYAEEPK